MRFLTTSQIARLHFGGSRSITNRRLRLLYDAGLIRTFVRDLASDNVYALAPGGRDALNEIDRADAAPSCPRRLDGQIDHLLATNTVRVTLTTTLTGGSLSDWRSDWELRGYANVEAVPDARFKITWQEIGERFFALEVEYHTRSPRKFVRKMLRYAAMQTGSLATDADNATILVVGRHPIWLERYRHAVASLSVSRSVWFSALAELEEKGADAAIWRPCWADQCFSLGALAKRPYGNGSLRAENYMAAQSYPSRPAHTRSSRTFEITNDPRIDSYDEPDELVTR